MSDAEQRRREWERRYVEGRTAWDRGGASPALSDWLAAIVAPARVLVPGCGNGHEVVELARRGFEVTAVDIAAQPVAQLRDRLDQAGVGAEVVQADLFDWQPLQPFDVVYEQTCLCAIGPGLWRGYEQRLHAWLRPQGVLLAAFLQTGRDGGPPFDCPVVRMRELFADERWAWPDEPPREVPHPNGMSERAVVLARR